MKKIKLSFQELISYSLIFFFLFSSLISFSQEKDDLYFNKNDRKRSINKNKKINSAQEILQDYRNQLNNLNDDSKVELDKNILNKYSNNTSNKESDKLKVIERSLKYNRDNLFVRPVNNNYYERLRNNSFGNSFNSGYYDPFAYERFMMNGYFSNWSLSNIFWNKTKWWMRLGRSSFFSDPLIIFSDPYYSMLYGNTMMISPIDYWGMSYGYNSICVGYSNGYSNGYYSGFNSFHYTNNKNKVVNNSNSLNYSRGPRISREGGIISGENVESFVNRGRSLNESERNGEIDNSRQRGSNSQNEYLRNRVTKIETSDQGIRSRAVLKEGVRNQYSRNRSMSLENRNSNRKISTIYSSYNQNDFRSNINRGSNFENSSYSSSRGSRGISSNDSGRRVNYSYSRESYNSRGAGSSYNNRSSFSSDGNRYNSGSNGGRSSSYNSGGGNFSSGGGFSSGGSSSGGSSSSGGNSSSGSSKGGSSRGVN